MEQVEESQKQSEHEDPQTRERKLAQWREVFRELEDAAWERMLGTLREGQKSDRQLSREIVEQGLLAHLKPDTIRVYIGKIRHVLTGDVSRSRGQVEAPEDREAEEPIEGKSSFEKLEWLIRIQMARVRKGSLFEGRLGGILYRQLSREIKLLFMLVKLALKWEPFLGAGNQPGMKVPVRICPSSDPAEDYKRVMAFRKWREGKNGQSAGSSPNGGPNHSEAHKEQTVEEMLRNVHRLPE